MTSYACKDAVLFGQNSKTVRIRTNDIGRHHANGMIIYAPNGNSTSLYLENDLGNYGFENTVIYANNTDIVSLTGDGHVIFRNMILYAYNASSIDIECNDGIERCRNMRIYLYESTFNPANPSILISRLRLGCLDDDDCMDTQIIVYSDNYDPWRCIYLSSVGCIPRTLTISPTYATSSPTVFTKPPSKTPTLTPTIIPTKSSIAPTVSPSLSPTFTPTILPTVTPSSLPSISPTASPTLFPTYNPNKQPTSSPSMSPTFTPTVFPTLSPSLATSSPSLFPTNNPHHSTNLPSIFPSTTPTLSPIIDDVSIIYLRLSKGTITTQLAVTIGVIIILLCTCCFACISVILCYLIKSKKYNNILKNMEAPNKTNTNPIKVASNINFSFATQNEGKTRDINPTNNSKLMSVGSDVSELYTQSDMIKTPK